jgi:hypothetical protein
MILLEIDHAVDKPLSRKHEKTQNPRSFAPFPAILRRLLPASSAAKPIF